MKKKLAWIVGGLVVVILAGLPYLYVKTNYSIADFEKNDKQALMSQVNQFIFDIADGKSGDAYNLTDKKSISLSDLQNTELQKLLKDYSAQNTGFHALTISKFISGRKIVLYKTAILFSNKTQAQIAIDALKEPDSNWVINGFGIATPPNKMW